MAIELHGAVACVTGGARGIGAATARALAAAGATVVIGDIDLDLAESIAEDIGPDAQAAHLDVADPASFAELVEFSRKSGPISLLVNNAGIMRTGLFVGQDLAMQLREVQINLGGVIIGMRLVLDEMMQRNVGHIVNVSSMAGKLTLPGAGVYCATKFGVVGLSRSIRAELHDSDVTVTTILPSAVSTELTAGLDKRGVPTVTADDVALQIVRSCSHGRAEVSVPRWLAPAAQLESALPERVGSLVKRALGTSERLARTSEEARSYDERTMRS